MAKVRVLRRKLSNSKQFVRIILQFIFEHTKMFVFHHYIISILILTPKILVLSVKLANFNNKELQYYG